jgi:hypothetical protein
MQQPEEKQFFAAGWESLPNLLNLGCLKLQVSSLQ